MEKMKAALEESDSDAPTKEQMEDKVNELTEAQEEINGQLKQLWNQNNIIIDLQAEVESLTKQMTVEKKTAKDEKQLRVSMESSLEETLHKLQATEGRRDVLQGLLNLETQAKEKAMGNVQLLTDRLQRMVIQSRELISTLDGVRGQIRAGHEVSGHGDCDDTKQLG